MNRPVSVDTVSVSKVSMQRLRSSRVAAAPASGAPGQERHGKSQPDMLSSGWRPNQTDVTSQEFLMLTRWEKVSNLKIVALLQPQNTPDTFHTLGGVLQVMLQKDLVFYQWGTKISQEKHCCDGK